MKKMSCVLVAVLLSLVVFRSDAFAAPIVFDITGTFENGDLLAGTLTIDTEIGSVTDVDLTIGALEFHHLHLIVLGKQGRTDVQVDFGPSQPDPLLRLIFPVANLVGYAGGQVCSAATPSCHPTALLTDPVLDLATGSATAVPTVPEPATLTLFGSGLLGVAARFRKRGRGRE
jgi:PEP-CTERM motif